MDQNAEIIANAIKASLNIIEQDREKEIISRRFGLAGPKETLEQIGEMLSITRERVRQLEKAILICLRIAAEEAKIPELTVAEKLLIRNLTEMGRFARISRLADKIYGQPTPEEIANLEFLGDISANLTIIDESINITPLLVSPSTVMLKPFVQNREIVAVIKAHKARSP